MNPKCAYRKGDVIRKGNIMGLVTENSGHFCTFHFIESHGPSTHTTTNLSIKHYLKIVKAESKLGLENRTHVVRNITLEQELLEAPNPQQNALINGQVDRLSETLKNKR